MSLKRKTVLGALWTIGTGTGARVIGLIGTLLLTRFVAPDDYGQVMNTWIIIATVSSITSLGYGQYLVANPKAGPDVAFHATFTFNAVGLVALLALLPLEGLLAETFNSPDLGLYLPLLVLAGSAPPAPNIARIAMAHYRRRRVG